MAKKFILTDLPVYSPVELINTGSPYKLPVPGLALCLSGGGYRAMLFHLGALWRLNELGYLIQIDRISSVSGGSITAAMLGFKWSKLSFDGTGVGQKFRSEVVEPIRRLAGRTIDVGAVIGGALGPGSIGDKVIAAYQKHLFGEATLQDLPDKPRFVINATNVQSGALWRFMKPYMRDYRVGEVKNPTIPLAVAVAASSAFPPFLSPVKLELDDSVYTPNSGQDLQYEPFTTDVLLTDGGVYDNLGLETAWKRYNTILVSDGGGKMAAEAEPKLDWARHTLRVMNLIDNQVRSLRKRQVIESFKLRDCLLKHGVNPDSDLFQRTARKGAYWGIWTNIANYGLANALDCPLDQTIQLANTPTRLKRLESELPERLVNWGYAVCDAALRKHVDPTLPAPGEFPYPGVGVG
jgi:NTE family protein